MKVVLALACLFAVTILASAWQNNFDEYLNVECPRWHAFSRIESIHSNHYEDRRWTFSCSLKPQLSSTCKWHHLVNEYDQKMLFQCPNNGAIAGVRSTHSNRREDRVFDFKCCNVYNANRQCSFRGYANNWDERMDFRVSGKYEYIRGAISVHDNKKEDRMWKFEVCS